MFISFNTDELSPQDIAVLRAVVGDAPVSAPSTPAPAAKASSPAKATTKAAPKAEKAAEPAEEPAEVAVAEEATDGPTMEDAVALATKLVSAGEAARVKAALAECGAKRVSELAEDKVGVFIAELS